MVGCWHLGLQAFNRHEDHRKAYVCFSFALVAGDIDDVFASDSEDEGQQQQPGAGYISEAEEEEDEFEAMFQGGKKKKHSKGRTHEVHPISHNV